MKFSLRTSMNVRKSRKGGVTILTIVLLLAMLAAAVFAIDYGYLLVVKTDLQRAADSAALAAVQDIIPDSNGSQDFGSARETIRSYAQANLGEEEFQVGAMDIEFGRFDPASVYSGFTILNSGIHDTVRVTLRRDDLNNSSVSLYFARLLGIENANVSASSTAILQKAQFLQPGADVLPIAIFEDTWNGNPVGTEWSIYGGGRLVDADGNDTPGNWGTLDIGSTSNSTADIADQINNGLRQEDLDSLYEQGAIATDTHIDSDVDMWLKGDTGFSSGMKSAIKNSHGKTKLIPIYSTLSGNTNGGNLDFHIVGWGVVEIVTSHWQGNKKSYVKVRKSYTYDGDLRPNSNLANTVDVIGAAYTTPVLVQ